MMVSLHNLVGLVIVSGLTFAAPVLASAGENRQPEPAKAYTETITFRKPGIAYQAIPMDDKKVISVLNSMLEQVSKKHYPLRQDRDL